MQSYFMRDIGSQPTGQTRNDKKIKKHKDQVDKDKHWL